MSWSAEQEHKHEIQTSPLVQKKSVNGFQCVYGDGYIKQKVLMESDWHVAQEQVVYLLAGIPDWRMIEAESCGTRQIWSVFLYLSSKFHATEEMSQKIFPLVC